MAESDATLWTVLAGIGGVLGLGALVAWYFGETLKRLLPSPSHTAHILQTRDIVLPETTRFRILIAHLDGDDNKSQTRHVEAALRSQQGLDVGLLGPGPRPFLKGSRTEHQIRAEQEAREMLARHNGDLLIWGEVARPDKRIRLQFLPREEGIEGAHRSYRLDVAELPKDFGTDLNAQLVALVLASLAPATEQRGHYLVDLLQEPAEKLARLLDKGAPDLEPDQAAGLQSALGNAALVIGDQSGDDAWLSRAVVAYKAALQERNDERVTLDWPTTENNLGAALQILGQRAAGAARLEEAVVAYRSALREHTRERVPLDWAMTQNNLGNALQTLGQRESGTRQLDDAVAAYRAALQERTRERVPLDWAMTQSNLGGALLTLGQRESGTARLEEAVSAYHAALEIFKEARADFYIGRTEANLAHAEALLAERRGGNAQ